MTSPDTPQQSAPGYTADSAIQRWVNQLHRRANRPIVLGVLLALAVAYPHFSGLYYMSLGIEALIFAIFAMSLDLLLLSGGIVLPPLRRRLLLCQLPQRPTVRRFHPVQATSIVLSLPGRLVLLVVCYVVLLVLRLMVPLLVVLIFFILLVVILRLLLLLLRVSLS